VEVCKWQAFEADCGHDSVVLIDRALFGRMQLGSCLTEDFGHVGCVADVRQLIEWRCAGRHDCRVELPDVALDRSPHGCPPDLLAYLEVEYHCQICKSLVFRHLLLSQHGSEISECITCHVRFTSNKPLLQPGILLQWLSMHVVAWWRSGWGIGILFHSRLKTHLFHKSFPP